MNILSQNYNQLIAESEQGYHIDFKYEKLFLTFPNACICIYDYETTNLLSQFQAHGNNCYVIEKLVFSDLQNMQNPKELMIFWAGEQKNIYIIDISQLDRPQTFKNAQKIKLKQTLNAIKAHPSHPIVYGGFSDGKIKSWNYETRKEVYTFGLENGPQSILCLDFTQ